MKRIYLSGLILSFAITILSAQDVYEIRSKSKGFSGGVHIGLLSYADDEIHAETESGFGYGAIVQYGFTHQFAASLAYQHYGVTPKSINSIEYENGENYPYTEFDLLARFIFGSTNSALRPSVAVGINYTQSEENFYDEFGFTYFEEYSGYSFCGGGGLSYFITPNIGLDLSLLFNSGTYTTTWINGQEIDFEHDFFSFKGLAGLTYHF